MQTYSSETLGLSSFDKLRRLAEQIQPGMLRYQVDRLLVRSQGGIQGQYITVYNELPGGRIEVTFDRNGGTCCPENRVTDPARVFVQIP